MIYLDGSRFFFDIEGCFSNLVERARKQNEELEHDKNAAELCKGFGKFFGAKSEDIRAGKDYNVLLSGILGSCEKVLVPEYDISSEHLSSAFENCEISVFKKTNDMKFRVEAVAEMAGKDEVKAIFLSNPCCPTALDISPEEIAKLASLTTAKVIVDESFSVDESVSALKKINEHENLIVLKKMHFGGEPVFACSKNLPEFDCEISAADQAAGKIIFDHDSAIKTAQRKLLDSRDSLYIRIKKLAIKFASLERLYRSKANCVFFRVEKAEERAKALEKMGIKILCREGCFCVFAGDKDENEAVLKALEEVLK